ncbi:MAG: major facilitator superfamily protein [Paenibacillus sp.]|uniref:TCR/Tet family MFS transporter n=1 Tax=Paenibacillus hemerocallicola TaxID=1172614 RepID=A0A5C4TDH2_9BACL|nr:MFS transporter [Paenibacillus hemerocallicola]MDF2661797.1 major facilitator superfamily protein [Paenibacillus sp.]TNJ67108.1 TCR/Tet family MFS transporter [Paenibacillus hemerocallicola]
MRKQLSAIMLLLMTIFIGFGIIIPVLPEIVGPFHLNMMLVLYSAVSFVMSPFWGSLSDRIGRRPVLLLGLAGFGVSFLLLGLAGDQLWLMYVSRILGGLFSGAATSCAVAYVADITTEENRTKGMGLVGMSIGLGFIFGPAVGGLLTGFGLSVPFFVASGLSFVTLLLAAARLQESLPASKRGDVRKRTSRWTAFSGSLKYLYVLSFFVTFTLAGLEGTLQYFEAIKFGAGPMDIGIMFLVSGIVGAGIQGGVVRRLVKPGDEPKVIAIGLVLSSLGFFLILLSTSLLTATIYLTVFAAGNALIRPCVLSLITQKTKVGQGVATGLNSSMDSLGRIAGPLMGMGAYHLNIHLPFAIGGTLCLAAITLLVTFKAADRQAKQASAAG